MALRIIIIIIVKKETMIHRREFEDKLTKELLRIANYSTLKLANFNLLDLVFERRQGSPSTQCFSTPQEICSTSLKH